jgi:hypothetical protein
MIGTTNLQVAVVADADNLVTISNNYSNLMGYIALKRINFQQLQDFQGHFGK